MRIPLAKPEILDSDIEGVVRVLRTPNLATGPALAEISNKTSPLTIGFPFPPSPVNSGTSALHLAVALPRSARGRRKSLSLLSLLPLLRNVLLQERMTPVFVDIDPAYAQHHTGRHRSRQSAPRNPRRPRSPHLRLSRRDRRHSAKITRRPQTSLDRKTPAKASGAESAREKKSRDPRRTPPYSPSIPTSKSRPAKAASS